MTVAYLDMFSGVSGDMLLGACLDAGVPLAELEAALAPLGLAGIRLAAEPTERHGIGATRCVVEVPDADRTRSLSDIVRLVESAGLDERVAGRAVGVFRRLAEAEARVHRTTPEEVHFHEVGALDAIVDVVGGVWCLDRLGVARLHASAFTLGRGGELDAAHGRLPVPPPAVLELVRGWPVELGDVGAELTTPTGAALVTTLAEGGGLPADFVPDRVGYGAGTARFAERPNLLRLVVGHVAPEAERLVVVECDLDDLDGRLYEPLAEALEAAGARDVAWIPIQMKKRRPGVTVRALVPGSRLGEVGRALFRETTTLGFRSWPVDRETLAREVDEVETPWGRIAVKRVRRPDGGWETRPEFDAVRAAAEATGASVREVLRDVTLALDRRDRRAEE